MTAPVLAVEDVHLSYGSRGKTIIALDGVSLTLDRGEALGVVGESGSGKSSLARVIVGMTRADSGQVKLDGVALAARRSQTQRRLIQMVFQDPASALNPRLTIAEVLSQLLRAHGIARGHMVDLRCRELLDLVGLPANVLDRRPGNLSGGQRQRASIARALAVNPEVLIADEATSSLDVSVQATILSLLQDLRRELSLTLLFISHNMAVVRHTCGRIAVMHDGKIVEQGETIVVLEHPQDAYTRLLVASVPEITP
jgi:ABC-type glutathione transport system ATPase component